MHNGCSVRTDLSQGRWISMSGKDKRKKECPICEAEVDEDEEVCPECGCYLEEPAYDTEDDLDE